MCGSHDTGVIRQQASAEHRERMTTAIGTTGTGGGSAVFIVICFDFYGPALPDDDDVKE